ncbi:hypothetical protein [Bradyrhizobium sp. SYSU BS000235]|uniref:hypothetical protein n=1 Tax=Bradyrhizobium sp. SYSU BS000235 TaxID=3411332 RepID=UPI003C783449
MMHYKTLRDDGQPVVRTTIAEAIDLLESDSATIQIEFIRLPSGRTAGLVCVIFEGQSGSKPFVVRLRSANYFQAFEQQSLEKQTFQIELLDGAKVDGRGTTFLRDGRWVRAVEVIPEPLPYELSDLDLRIIQLTISMMDAEDRCYRSLRSGVPEAHQASVPDLRFLDFSTLLPTNGRPPLPIPLLKQIKAEYSNRYPGEKTPSEQKISDALAKAGLRSPERRPRSAAPFAVDLPHSDLDRR